MIKTLTARKAAGTVSAVSSKSCLHRALICAALCEEETHIFCTAPGDDVQATANCLRTLGAKIAETAKGYAVHGGLTAKEAQLDCRQSGTTLRFLLPLAAALGIKAAFVCEAQLRRRPMTPLMDALNAHGCRVVSTDTGYACEGQLHGGEYSLPGDVSSQYLSGFLLSLPLLVDGSRIMLTSKLYSAPYVRLTQAVQAQFGIGCSSGIRSEESSSFAALRMARDDTASFSVAGKQRYQSPKTLTVEGDWSNAAPFLCAGAFSEACVTVTGLSLTSEQGDRAMCDLLRQFGAQVFCAGDAITVKRGQLHGCRIDAADIPDLVPLLALLGACAEGETTILGASRLRGKESDRLLTTAQTLNTLGADISVTPDGLTVRGVPALYGGTVSACGDHRIAMLAAVASLACTAPVVIEGAEAVSKSYPDFFSDFATICR